MATLARSPAFDLALTTRVLSVVGMEEMASPAPLGQGKWYGVDRNPATGTMVAEFDCPADAWFFAGAPRDDLMPYSILMEIALQTCGILTSWNKVRVLVVVVVVQQEQQAQIAMCAVPSTSPRGPTHHALCRALYLPWRPTHYGARRR